jgi:hypothetical protein
MAGIQNFIATVTSNLGVSEGAASAGLGGLFGVLRNKLGAEFGDVETAIPGADELAKAAPGGGLMGMLASVFGKGGSSTGAVSCMLAKSGISTGKLQGFLKMFVEFLKSNLSPDLMKSIAAKVPALKPLVG